METTMNMKWMSKASIFLLAGTLFAAGCAGGPLSTREKGAGVGALGGAAAGGLIGAAVGHPGAGAAIGGGLGLGAGALVGDQHCKAMRTPIIGSNNKSTGTKPKSSATVRTSSACNVNRVNTDRAALIKPTPVKPLLDTQRSSRRELRWGPPEPSDLKISLDKKSTKRS